MDEGSKARDAIFRAMFGTDKPVVKMKAGENFTDIQFGKIEVEQFYKNGKDLLPLHRVCGLTEEQWMQVPGKVQVAPKEAKPQEPAEHSVSLSFFDTTPVPLDKPGWNPPTRQPWPESPFFISSEWDGKEGFATLGIKNCDVVISWRGPKPDFDAILRNAGFKW